MTRVPANIGAITLFVEDLPAARSYYERVFGLPVHFADPVSAVFRFGDVLVNLLDVREAPDLVGPAPIARADAGARFQLTIQVPDVDAALTALVAQGGEVLNGPVDRPWGARTAAFRDPAGHTWELAGPVLGTASAGNA